MQIISRKEAKEQGLKRYFTGKSCKHGHISERWVGSHSCVECRTVRRAKQQQKDLLSRAIQKVTTVRNRKYMCYCKHNIPYTSYRAANLTAKKTYFIGEACSKGHITARYVSTCDCVACVKIRGVVWNHENKDRLNQYQHEYKHSPVLYDTYHKQLIGVTTKSAGGTLEVTCYHCGKWFMPTGSQVNNKIRASLGRKNRPSTQNNLYCSEDCKDKCDVYRVQNTKKSERSDTAKSRCADQRNKNALLESQIDVVGYNYCEKCGKKTTELDIHHTVMVSKDHKEGTNPAHQILLCRDTCHKEPWAHCRK